MIVVAVAAFAAGSGTTLLLLPEQAVSRQAALTPQETDRQIPAKVPAETPGPNGEEIAGVIDDIGSGAVDAEAQRAEVRDRRKRSSRKLPPEIRVIVEARENIDALMAAGDCDGIYEKVLEVLEEDGGGNNVVFAVGALAKIADGHAAAGTFLNQLKRQAVADFTYNPGSQEFHVAHAALRATRDDRGMANLFRLAAETDPAMTQARLDSSLPMLLRQPDADFVLDLIGEPSAYAAQRRQQLTRQIRRLSELDMQPDQRAFLRNNVRSRRETLDLLADLLERQGEREASYEVRAHARAIDEALATTGG